LLVAFFASLYGPVSIWAPRHLIGSAVALFCLLGVLLSRSPVMVAWPLAVCFATWTVMAAPGSFPSRSKPPYRALTMEFSKPGETLVGVEDWVVRPVRYYSPTPVRYLSDPELPKNSPLILVCRTVRCEAKAQYESVLLRSVTWTAAPQPTSTIEVYLLHRKLPTAALDP
jgi:hypothetical protein